MSSTNPEVYNVLHCRQKRTESLTATVNVSVLAPGAVGPAPFPGRKSYVALVFVFILCYSNFCVSDNLFALVVLDLV